MKDEDESLIVRWKCAAAAAVGGWVVGEGE